MTRKQAIEAAQDWAWAQDKSGDGLDHNAVARLSATHAYDLGRVAGMREAARRVLARGCRIDHCPHCTDAVELRDVANALVRKLRKEAK